mgnify:CR=1 FL=1
MKEPHVHAELIKAWADGFEIQTFYPKCKEWVDCPEPFWSEKCQYRIKPEIIPDVVKKYNVSLNEKGWTLIDTNDQIYCPANLILFFDGVSGHLINAEVI